MAQNSHYYNDSFPLIGKVRIGESTYELKDAWARQAIDSLGDVMNFLGTTTDSNVYDGSNINQITTSEGTVTAAKGDVVINTTNSKEFVWDGTHWREFGDLAHLAVQSGTTGITIDTGTTNAKTVLTAATLTDNATSGDTGAINVGGQTISGAGNFVNSIEKVTTIENGDLDITPTITSTFAGTAFTSEGSYTPAGAVSQPTFTGTALTSTGSYTPEGTITVGAITPAGTIGTGEGTPNYTPTGSISAPEFTGTQATISVSGTPTGDVTSTFTGAPATINSTFTGSQATISVSGTAEGSIIEKAEGFSVVTGQASLTGGTLPTLGEAGTSSFATEGVTVAYDTSVENSETLVFTVAGTASAVTTQGTFNQGAFPTLVDASTTAIGFSGTAFTSTGTYTPEGTVIGSYTPEGTITSTFAGNSLTSTGSYTPEGTVDAPTFEGTGVKFVFNGTETTPTATFAGTQDTISVSGTPAGTVSQPEFTGTQATISVSGTPTGAVTSTASTIGIQFGTGAISGTTEAKYIKFTTTEGTLTLHDNGHTHTLSGTSAV